MMFTTTFYSFKGGVGRTLALMNVAYELVSKGNKVTVVDFDLEAPGMQTFNIFKDALNNKGTLKVKGIADFISEYTESCKSKPVIPNINNFLYKVPNKELSFKNKQKKGALWFVPASQSLKREAVQDINWEELYKKFKGYLLFEELKSLIYKKTKCDYLLIDSRTGLTDHSSICTKQFPDLLVSLFFPNDQNINGLKEITDDVKIFKKKGGHIPILYVGSRIPVGDDEENIIEEQINKAQNKLNFSTGKHFSDFLQLSHNSSFDLVKQTLLVERSSENIRLKNEYLKLTSEIEIMNKNSLLGNINFIQKADSFLKSLLYIIIDGADERKNLSEILFLIDVRLSYIFKNFPFNQEIISGFEIVVTTMSNLPQHIKALDNFKFLNFLYSNRNLVRLYSSILSLGKKNNEHDESMQKKLLANLDRSDLNFFNLTSSIDDFLIDSFDELEFEKNIISKFASKDFSKLNTLIKSCANNLIKFAIQKKDEDLIKFDRPCFAAMNYLLVKDFENIVKVTADYSIAEERRISRFTGRPFRIPGSRFVDSNEININNFIIGFESKREGTAVPYEIVNFYKHKSPYFRHMHQEIYKTINVGHEFADVKKEFQKLSKDINFYRNIFQYEYCILNTLINWNFEKNYLNRSNLNICHRTGSEFDSIIETSKKYFPKQFDVKLEHTFKYLMITCIIFLSYEHQLDPSEGPYIPFKDTITETDMGFDFFDLRDQIIENKKVLINSPFHGNIIGFSEILDKYDGLGEVRTFKDLCNLFNFNLHDTLNNNFLSFKSLDK